MQCKYCGNEVKDDAKFCGYCGSVMEAVPAAPAVAEAVCQNCGAAVKPDAAFCVNCGASLKTVVSEPVAVVEEDVEKTEAMLPAEEAKPENACPSCGAELKPDAAFCVNCGTALNAVVLEPVAVVEEDVEKTEAMLPAEEAKPENACSNCGAELKPDAAFCVNCGMVLNAVKPEPVVQQPVMDQMPVQNANAAMICPHCGAPLSPDAVFCVNCGASLGVNTTTDTEAEAKPRKGLFVLFWILVGLIVAAGAVIIFFALT